MSSRILTAILTVFIALLALPIISQALKSAPTHQTDGGSLDMPVAEATTKAVPAQPVPPQPAPRQPSVMTRRHFDQIGRGMTYAQCVQLIGCEGEPLQTGGPNGQAEYAWQLIDNPSSTVRTGEATLKFQNGIFCGKGLNSNSGRRAAPGELNESAILSAQRPATPPYICRSVNDGIKDGCGYAECVRLLGMEGRYLGRRQASGGTVSANGTLVPIVVDVYVWWNPSIQVKLTASFRDGKLMGRQIATGSFAGER